MTTVMHLTETGPRAGEPLCGLARRSAELQGDTFQHRSFRT